MRRRRLAVAVAVEALEGRALCDAADIDLTLQFTAVVSGTETNRVGDIEPPLNEAIVPNSGPPWYGEGSPVDGWIDPFR